VHYDFCTLFDRNYLLRGLALHQSLMAHVKDFTLWILCMDDTSHEVLSKMDLPRVRLVSLGEFEDEVLLGAKKTRSAVEYCWTCTPSLPLYLLEKHPEMEMITYLDADLFFFSDPAPVLAEMNGASIGIMEHRYAPRWEHLAGESGVYVVQFLSFRNGADGLTALRWWRDRCVEWCYRRVEDGKLGDQGYLADWLERFDGVIVYRHVGAGLAPWNFERHRISHRGEDLYVDDVPLIFCHFHSFAILRGGTRFAPGHPEYAIGKAERGLLYEPYVAAVKRAIQRVRQVEPGFAYGIDDAVADEYFARVRALRRSRVIGAMKSVPPLRWTWNVAKRLAGRGPSAPMPLAPGDQRDSWKTAAVAEQQQALVERELRDPMAVPPFRTFVDLVGHLAAAEPDRVFRFLDVGCGVGHYSALLERYYPGRFEYTGTDFSAEMIDRARALWSDAQFVVDDVFDIGIDYGDFDIVMASALVDVIEDFWTVVDILLAHTGEYLILHRQRVTAGPSYSKRAPGYDGQTTYATFLNRCELEKRARAHGMSIDKESVVSDGLHSFLLRKDPPVPDTSPSGSSSP
jgi:SAM-dependent methyltransferase